MNIAFYRKTIETVRKRISLDLIEKIDTQWVKFGKSKVTIVDKSADCEKINLYECKQCLITISFIEYPKTIH